MKHRNFYRWVLMYNPGQGYVVQLSLRRELYWYELN